MDTINTGIGFLDHDNSMLTRRFGKETVNYYSGGSLNRYSFLRSDYIFLRNAFKCAEARFMILDKLNALTTDDGQIAWLKLDEVDILTGSEYSSANEQEFVDQYDSTAFYPLMLFLGLSEHGPEKKEKLATTDHGTIEATPFFAIDVTSKGVDTEAIAAFLKKQAEKNRTIQINPRAMPLQPEQAAIYAQARSMIDWNTRNSFCAGCGNPNLSIYAGYKRVCPPSDHATTTTTRPDCPTRHGISNICFPRTDPTMIAAIVSADGQRILLGRQKRFPPFQYSALAGFLEPGESIEESVRREVWEEAGVKVGRVVVHSSQPWPYPSSLMIGAVAQALPGGENVDLQDRELEDARWFTLDEVRAALGVTAKWLGGAPPKEYVEGSLRVPPPQAIANRLLTAVVEGFLNCSAKI